ncbi:branched-chain amino acid transaminase [Candidatus Woesearchaeota archaeon]|nr:branched-chain amino acid transaminase [Candidatus Woesearchaeota archaeon]
MKPKIWFNGKLVDWKDCNIHITSYSLHYGAAAFEGIRFYETAKGIALFRLKDHIKRLVKSSEILGMYSRYNENDLVNAAKLTVKSSGMNSGYLRPIVFYGESELYVHAKDSPVNAAMIVLPWKKYLKNNAVKVMSSSYMRLHPKSVPMEAKISGYYANSLFAIIEARKNGFDEALLADYKGNAAEGPAENFFIVKNNVLMTPPLGNILPGVTRDSIIALAKDNKIRVQEKNFRLEDAKKADEAFFTGTGAEITPIIQIDKEKIGNGKIGYLTKKLTSLFRDVVSGKNKKYDKWLEYV